MAEEKFMGKREYERTNGTKKEHLGVTLDKIFIREGFNPRDMSKPETLEKIACIEASYLAGRHVPMIEVSLVKNRLEIVDGECRFTAACRANQKMIDDGLPGIILYEVIWFGGNDAEKLLMTVQANEGERLLPIEVCEVVRKLVRLGWSAAMLEESLGYSRQWIDTLLFMYAMLELIKGFIRHGKVSGEVAIALYKKHDEDAVGIIQAMIDGSGAKITAKSLPKKIKPATAAYEHAKQFSASFPCLDFPQELLEVAEDDAQFTVQISAKALRALIAMKECVEVSK